MDDYPLWLNRKKITVHGKRRIATFFAIVTALFFVGSLVSCTTPNNQGIANLSLRIDILERRLEHIASRERIEIPNDTALVIVPLSQVRQSYDSYGSLLDSLPAPKPLPQE